MDYVAELQVNSILIEFLVVLVLADVNLESDDSIREHSSLSLSR